MEHLDKFNRRRRQEIEELNTWPRPNGLACPQCGAPLLDSDGAVLTSYPPQKNVHCDKCRYRGYRVA